MKNTELSPSYWSTCCYRCRGFTPMLIKCIRLIGCKFQTTAALYESWNFICRENRDSRTKHCQTFIKYWQ